MAIFRKIRKIVRENPEIHPSYHFNDFCLKNDYLGLKMKVLKFLGIEPKYFRTLEIWSSMAINIIAQFWPISN